MGAAQSNVASAQGKAFDQYSWVHNGNGWIQVPISEDGEYVYVWTQFMCVCHWVNYDQQIWMHMWYDFTFEHKGEVFTTKEKQDWAIGAAKNDDFLLYGDVTFVCNARGDRGTHILASGMFHWSTWTFEIDKFIIQPKE